MMNSLVMIMQHNIPKPLAQMILEYTLCAECSTLIMEDVVVDCMTTVCSNECASTHMKECQDCLLIELNEVCDFQTLQLSTLQPRSTRSGCLY